MNRTSVRIAVDELVLDGVAVDDPAVEAALERALGPALAEHGAGAATGDAARAVVAEVAQEVPR